MTKYEMSNHLYGFFDASVTDGKWMLALHYARTAITSRRYPQSRLLHGIMSKILLVSTFMGKGWKGLYVEIKVFLSKWNV